MLKIEPIRWTSWNWNSECAVLKWEYGGNARLWYAVLNHLTESPLALLWRGSKPAGGCNSHVIRKDSACSILHAGYRVALCADYIMLSEIQSKNQGARCLLFDPGERNLDELDARMINKAFCLPDSVSPERAMREGWKLGERPFVDMLGVSVASLLFWDDDFVDVQSKTHTVPALNDVFQKVTINLGVSILRDDDL